MNCPVVESLKEFLEPLHFPDKKLVIFPVNDNDDVSKAEGGSHWSLLAFEKNSNVFIHHDSFKGVNKQHAKRLFDAVVGYMGVSNSAPGATYLECNDSPQQVNGYDCGLYVTAIAKAICSWHESGEDKDGDDLWFSVVKQQVEPSSVATMRDEILSIIRGLMATEESASYKMRV